MQGLVSRIAVGVFGLLTVAMLLLAVFDERGALAVRERRMEKEKLQQEIDKINEDNKRHREEIENLQHNPDYIERRAREELRLVKPGEIILELPQVPVTKDQPPEKVSPREQK